MYSDAIAFATAMGTVSRVVLTPRTGRQHQLRVHLRSVGAPVRQEASSEFSGLEYLGAARHAAVELALRRGAEFMLFCDFDRALRESCRREAAQVDRVTSQSQQLAGMKPV